MTAKEDKPFPIKSRFLLYQTEDGRMRIEVRLENETVWLSQLTMTELFQTSKQNISLHLKNIFNEGELAENRVVKEYLTTAQGDFVPTSMIFNFSNLSNKSGQTPSNGV